MVTRDDVTLLFFAPLPPEFRTTQSGQNKYQYYYSPSHSQLAVTTLCIVRQNFPMSSAAACWICLDGGSDALGKPVVRDCACRGNDAGFAHMSCIIEYAQKKSEQAETSNEFGTPWEKCPNCTQYYQNNLMIHLSDAFVSFAKQTYGYPGNQLDDKMKVMKALQRQIHSNLSATSDVSLPKDKIENLIHKLLAMVDQAKEEHDMSGWGRMPPTTFEFLKYRYICYTEAFGYDSLAQLYSRDKSEESRNSAIGYYSRARAILDEFGDEIKSKLMTEKINLVRAESKEDKERSWKALKNIYHNKLESEGPNAEGTILSGYHYADCLISANHSIKAERLLTKLVATSRQVYGDDHICTSENVSLLKKCKARLVQLAFAHDDGIFLALKYENDEEICIVFGPVVENQFEKGKILTVASAMVHPSAGCPVICWGLINAPHLNGKLGEVRSISDANQDSSAEVRFGVHFEEKGLKPAAVKAQNLRIAFELPSV